MSYRELSMIDVKEVLRRAAAGQSAREMARQGVVSRRTARRYIEAARACGVALQDGLSEEALREVLLQVQQRPATEPSEPWTLLMQERQRIEAWLSAEPSLTLVRVHELLARDGIAVSYTTLRRFAQRELGVGRRGPTVRIDDPPAGHEAQVDFGLAGYVRSADGKRRKLWMLLVTLPMSRYMFAWPTFVQTVEALCDGLDAAWRFFEGVPHTVVLDNMSAAVSRADAQDPGINPSFAEYAQSRGFFVDPARVRRPQDKARVENQVPFVRERWFAGEAFDDDLHELRKSAAHWCREVAGMRVHGTTRLVPREVFEAQERSALLPAPVAPFDVPRWSKAKVHPDHHVQVARALYSVPTRYLGRTLRVRSDRHVVRLYAGSELVKVHPRMPPGKRSTDPNDYPQGKAPYATRSIDTLLERAHKHGAQIGVFAQRLLAGPLPWTRMRQGYGLLRLCERYGSDRVEALCARSLAFDVVDVPRIERMLKSAQRAEQHAVADGGHVVQLPQGRFARDAASFVTVAPKKGGE